MMKIKRYHLILVLLVIIFWLWFITTRKNYVVKKSPIHGVGIFAKKDLKPNEILDCVINSKNIITPHFGRLINHSSSNDNTDLIHLPDDGYYLKTTKYVSKGSEILSNYDGPSIPSFILGSKPHYI